MNAAVSVTVAPGKVDDVARKVGELDVKDVLNVAGRVDVVVFLEGSKEEALGKIKGLFEIEEVETTETLWEVEGWLVRAVMLVRSPKLASAWHSRRPLSVPVPLYFDLVNNIFPRRD